MAKSRSKEEPPKFEEALAELEAIIARIESGETGLEESLAQYERGMKLIGECRTILSTAEQKIAELTADAKGKLRLEKPDRETDQGIDESGGESAASGGSAE